MLRIAFLIFSGNATGSLLLLARNLIVARLIPVEDYGIAATFAVVMAMVEMASAFGLQQQIVQSKDGDDPRFQAALQGFQVLRGIIAGVVLFLIAGPIARFLGIPEVIWAYQLLALVPVIKAFEHFDIHRLNRHMRFWPMILTGSLPGLLSLLMVWPLAAWLGDWRVLLYAILAQMALTTITSYLVSERPYRLVLDRFIMGESLRFGWPILVTSALLFLVFQGDKLIVGRVLGMESLAIFAMGMTLTLTPVLVLARSARNFFLPQLSKNNRTTSEGEARFQYVAVAVLEFHILAAAGFVCLIAIFDHLIISNSLGEKYSSLVEILILISVVQCIHLLKNGPSLISLSNGQTKHSMLSNCPRIFLLPLSYWIVVESARLDLVILTSMMGEVVGLLVAIILLKKRSKVILNKIIAPMIAWFIICLLSIFQLNSNFSNYIIGAMILILALSFLTTNNLKRYLFLRMGIF